MKSQKSDSNNNTDEKTYMLQAGIYASAMEHGVLEQVTGIESVSTIKTFQYAQEHDIPMHTIVKENLNDELNAISVSTQVKQEIRSAVNSGKTVIIPEREITINQWSGVGYMVLDLDTFACGYMISGGLAGGSMSVPMMIGEYVGYVILGVISGILLQLVASCITTGWVGALFTIFKVALMMNWILELYDLYLSWETTGEVRYIQEMAVQLAAGATVYGLFKFGLRNKIQEFIKWADTINIGGKNSGTPNAGGNPGTGQGEGGTPGNNDFAEPTPKTYEPSEKVKSDILKHLTEGDEHPPTSKKPNISGAHKLPRFKDLIAKYNCRIVNETPLEEGISRIEYELPAKDKAGNIIQGQYKATPQYKTVYDPEIISDLEFMNRGFEAFQNALSENPNLPRQWFAPDNNGLEWTGFTNSAGEPTNFFPAD